MAFGVNDLGWQVWNKRIKGFKKHRSSKRHIIVISSGRPRLYSTDPFGINEYRTENSLEMLKVIENAAFYRSKNNFSLQRMWAWQALLVCRCSPGGQVCDLPDDIGPFASSPRYNSEPARLPPHHYHFFCIIIVLFVYCTWFLGPWRVVHHPKPVWG